jgi:mannose/fructose/N-acetylgalactosamine-specific phosphotransferase system component IIC
MEFIKLLVIAATLEAIWETMKMFWQEGKANPDRIGAAVLGIFLCLAAGVDFFEMVQIPLSVPMAGMILSGLLVSRGANFIHDLLATINNLRSNTSLG